MPVELLPLALAMLLLPRESLTRSDAIAIAGAKLNFTHYGPTLAKITTQLARVSALRTNPLKKVRLQRSGITFETKGNNDVLGILTCNPAANDSIRDTTLLLYASLLKQLNRRIELLFPPRHEKDR